MQWYQKYEKKILNTDLIIQTIQTNQDFLQKSFLTLTTGANLSNCSNFIIAQFQHRSFAIYYTKHFIKTLLERRKRL